MINLHSYFNKEVDGEAIAFSGVGRNSCDDDDGSNEIADNDDVGSDGEGDKVDIEAVSRDGKEHKMDVEEAGREEE